MKRKRGMVMEPDLETKSDAKGRGSSALPYPNPEPHGIMVVPDYRRSSKELTQSSALWFV
jgi:hypothetical protein